MRTMHQIKYFGADTLHVQFPKQIKCKRLRRPRAAPGACPVHHQHIKKKTYVYEHEARAE